MRRGCIALAIAVPLLASLMGGVGAAHARPLPSSAVMQSLLLTKEEMIGASGYKGQLTEAGGASCNDTPGGGRDCAYGVQPADYNLPDSYPSMVVITGFPTIAGATKHWREHNLKPTAWSGETIAIVTKTARVITFTATPSNPDQMAWAWTSIKGKQGIMMAQCTANRAGADLKALAECSSKVAAALGKKVKAKRPRTPLA
jgi:hypothetical protein